MTKALQNGAAGDRRSIVELRKLTGPQAGSLKYDLLTALTVAGLHGNPTLQSSMLRLCAMVTARYNWRLDEISIGQAELARLWSVNERTVKREMKRLTGQGWLICIRPGVRGRVGVYRLDYPKIYDQTQPHWQSVGSDFEARMAEMSGARKIVQVDFTTKSTPKLQAVPSSDAETSDIQTCSGAGWEAVSRRLRMNHPELFESWFSKLKERPESTEQAGILELSAPNSFVGRYIETHLLKYVEEAAEMAAKSAGLPVPELVLRCKS